MGQTNLLSGLKTKYAALTGEAAFLDAQITKITADYSRLGELEARVAALNEGIGHVTAVIRMIEKTWDEASVKPVKPHTRNLPMKPGTCASTTLEIMRTAVEPMTARDVALEVLERNGIVNPDVKLRLRATNTVDATLRKHKGRIVTCDDSWPRKWRKAPRALRQ